MHDNTTKKTVYKSIKSISTQWRNKIAPRKSKKVPTSATAGSQWASIDKQTESLRVIHASFSMFVFFLCTWGMLHKCESKPLPCCIDKQTESLPVIHTLLSVCVFLMDLTHASYMWESPFTVFWQTGPTFINGKWGFRPLPARNLGYAGLIVRFSNFTDSTCTLICIVKVMSSGLLTPTNATGHFICKVDGCW